MNTLTYNRKSMPSLDLRGDWTCTDTGELGFGIGKKDETELKVWITLENELDLMNWLTTKHGLVIQKPNDK